MESKLADDIAPLSGILGAFRELLTSPKEECDWETVINYFGHIELYRREVVNRARETIEQGSLTQGALNVLQKLANAELAAKRRKNYTTLLLLLCCAHIRHFTCGDQDYLVPSLLKKYYPPAGAEATWAPHVGLSYEERERIVKEKVKMLQYLKGVNEWEGQWEEEDEGNDDQRRMRYLEHFGDPFGGDPSIGKVALEFAAKVENNADALDRLLRFLDT
jgi:hypothetical protein